jgi:recombination protein RecA
MPSAAALRLEIERTLERRFPAALTPVPRTIHEVWATGIDAVDELLHGGLAVGEISEFTGPAASGRTSLALNFLGQRTREGRAGAWVDVNDAFDPQSAAANGVRLKQLLWVRCRDDAGTGAAARGIANANKRQARTPTLRTTWTRLDQGLRATDLLLQAGGFAVIVLDLCDTAPEQGIRIPAATWFRFRQAAERTQGSLVVLGKRAYAQSAAGVVLEFAAAHAQEARGTVLRGFEFAVRRGRERFAPVEITTRKPGPPATGLRRWGGKPPAATWHANAAWDAERVSERTRA